MNAFIGYFAGSTIGKVFGAARQTAVWHFGNGSFSEFRGNSGALDVRAGTIDVDDARSGCGRPEAAQRVAAGSPAGAATPPAER